MDLQQTYFSKIVSQRLECSMNFYIKFGSQIQLKTRASMLSKVNEISADIINFNVITNSLKFAKSITRF